MLEAIFQVRVLSAALAGLLLFAASGATALAGDGALDVSPASAVLSNTVANSSNDSLARDVSSTPGHIGASALANGSLVAVAQNAGSVLMADKLVVEKSARRLLLMRRGEILRSYRVALGLSPVGHKEREGDFKTPEGEYRLIRRNPHSDYFLSMEISYPNSDDLANAQRSRVRPGGSIMLHGWPNTPHKNADYYKHNDWTDGCIAVSNADMVEIWLMTPIDTPIEIRP